jgi:hypothetical protein
MCLKCEVGGKMAEAYYDIGTADDHLISRLGTREAVISLTCRGSFDLGARSMLGDRQSHEDLTPGTRVRWTTSKCYMDDNDIIRINNSCVLNDLHALSGCHTLLYA